ncbi:MAG: pilus assembly protein PilB [Desulfuromonas sp.]|nr:MAG: pilus assembly protein PilB [Desulfuromonas sp.]
MNATKKIGEILVENKLVSPDRIEEALEIQSRSPYQALGRFLVQLKYVGEKDLQYLLDTHNKRQKLVDILLKHKMIEQDDLELAISMSNEEKRPLMQVLLNLEFISKETAAKAVSIHFDLPYFDLSEMTIPFRPALINSVKPQFAKRNKIVPVGLSDTELTIAAAKPLKKVDIDQLESTLKLKVKTGIATPESIEELQENLYSPGKALSGKAFDGANTMLETQLDQDEQENEEDDFADTQVTEKDSVLVKIVNQLIHDAYLSKASDIHIEPYPGKQDVVVRMRIDGRCEVYQRIHYKYRHALVSRIKIMADLDISERRRPQDGKINFKKYGPIDVELRIATMPTAGGLEDVVIRLLHTGKVIEFDKLNFTPRNKEVLQASLKKPYGMVLVVGPTGSGKTTTLHAGIATINNPQVKIWTAEDPVEITQAGLRQVQVNPKIGFTFASALRSFLRLDPDIMMVGEMRDKETASISVEASLTGHLVMSTLHTNSAPETITRLLDLGLDPFSFSDSLLCISAQRLARKLCENCKVIESPSQKDLDELIVEYGGAEVFCKSGIDKESVRIGRPVGCELCLNTGFSGRIGIHEVLECTDAMKDLIKYRPKTSDIRELAVSEGMLTLKQDGIQKICSGLTDIHEIRRVCM